MLLSHQQLTRSFVASVSVMVLCSAAWASSPLATGSAAFTDYSQEQPGVRRKLSVQDLPAPYATESVNNGPRLVPRPLDAWPKCLPGFKVDLYATKLENPRLIRVAPNGDLFLAESGPGEIKMFHGTTNDGKASEAYVFATGLKQPFGIAFYPLGPDPKWLYVANTDSVVRFPYKNGDTQASGRIRDHRFGYTWGRASSRWWTLDARRRVLERWQTNVCLSWIKIKC